MLYGEIMSIGDRIIELRKKRNLSQAQLADRMSVSRQAVSKWENEQTSPDTLKLIQLADVLDTDVEFLATGRTLPRTPTPIVVNIVEQVDKVVEKVVEKPVISRVERIKYLRNPVEFILFGLILFIIGFVIGAIIC